MKEDIQMAKKIGVYGVVFGVLTPSGNVDIPRNKELVELAKPLSTTFHRAFDMTSEPFQALEDLIILGIDRILTSGQDSAVLEGIPLLKELFTKAAGRIQILPGCGITTRNIGRILKELPVEEIHMAYQMAEPSLMSFRNENVYMVKMTRISPFHLFF